MLYNSLSWTNKRRINRLGERYNKTKEWLTSKKKEVKPIEVKPVKVKESHPTECICKECMDTLANEIMNRKQVITDESE